MPLTKMGRWNDIPASLLPKIPNKPMLATYEFVWSTIDPITKKKRYKASEHLPSESVVVDPESKMPIPIILAGGVDQNGNVLHTTIRQIRYEPEHTNGLITLTIGAGHTPMDELYQYFEMASFNGSNPNRDKNVTPIIARKDYEAEATAEVAQLEKEQEAISLILSTKGAELSDMAILFGVNADLKEAQVKAALSAIARKNPEHFMDATNDPDRPAKSVLAAGLANGSLSIDVGKSAIIYAEGGSTILPINRTDREGAMGEWAAFIRTNKDGATTLKGMKTIVDLKTKKDKAK